MLLPFDIEIGEINYAVFPEGNDTYVIFKDGKEYVQIQKDTAEQWLKFDKETALPLFDYDEEVNQIGKQIDAYNENPPEEEDEEDLD
ncbi:hypothetical protein EZ428_02805 [Pedobacter frigiditerrae]|uniref:Uncharacterized protein n=1 Tax=Pedobacter frigiditerrae TaxID=2530452 RepID=A0A4R0N2X7_9SPHI|nr:hypothetical protein [Pedobacter frigiditerrae]TCC93717.1 hypothetical protein EZ428_02805 [Pedobacter frigiditerrae]